MTLQNNNLHLPFLLLCTLNNITVATKKITTIELEPAPSQWNDYTGTGTTISNTFLKVVNTNATTLCYSICEDDDGKNNNNIAEERLEDTTNCDNVKKTCGGTFELDLQSHNTLEFVLRPPPSSSNNEIVFFYPSNHDNTIDLVLEAHGNCVNPYNTPKTQFFTAVHISASIFGSSVDGIIDAYSDEDSAISINEGGCGIYSRLRFRVLNGMNEGGILGSFSELKWSAEYDESFIAPGPISYSYGTLEENGEGSSGIAASVEVKEVFMPNNGTIVESTPPPPKEAGEEQKETGETQNVESDKPSSAFSFFHGSGAYSTMTSLFGSLFCLVFF